MHVDAFISHIWYRPVRKGTSNVRAGAPNSSFHSERFSMCGSVKYLFRSMDPNLSKVEIPPQSRYYSLQLKPAIQWKRSCPTSSASFRTWRTATAPSPSRLPTSLPGELSPSLFGARVRDRWRLQGRSPLTR